MHNAQDVSAAQSRILECLGEHVRAAVGTDGLEALVQKADRVEARAGGDVEDGAYVASLELVDEEAAFAFCPLLPVDEFVPLLNEADDVLLRVVVGVPNVDRVVAELLLGNDTGTGLQPV